jgi:hypothetical protein
MAAKVAARRLKDSNFFDYTATYYILTPKQMAEFNKKFEFVLTAREYIRALHFYERKHGYRENLEQYN